nr:PREDICTED: uncharacterized protein LOC104000022 isoform X2 [Musa acuminata subsp. malaccensis]
MQKKLSANLPVCKVMKILHEGFRLMQVESTTAPHRVNKPWPVSGYSKKSMPGAFQTCIMVHHHKSECTGSISRVNGQPSEVSRKQGLHWGSSFFPFSALPSVKCNQIMQGRNGCHGKRLWLLQNFGNSNVCSCLSLCSKIFFLLLKSLVLICYLHLSAQQKWSTDWRNAIVDLLYWFGMKPPFST